MAEGLLPPTIARLVMDASEYAAGQAKAVTATQGIQAEMDKADLSARKMAASMEAAAQTAAAAQQRQAAAAQEATAATQELAAVQKELTNGEITAAEAATRQAAAQERLALANQSEARAALQGERASIAQAEAQLGAGRAATENAAANEAAATRATGAWGRFNGVLGQIKTLGALAIGAVAVEAVKMSTEFNKQMEALHTQAGAAQSEVDQLKNKVLALAPAVGFGPDKLAEALYHIESVGYRGADAMAILHTAADGAQVGQASLDDTTYALTSTMKSFEMEGVGGATQAMGALNAIVGQGDMRMSDLNAAIGTGIASTAQTFGLSIESMGAGLTFLTDRGEKANTASTRLAMGITLMAAPSAKAAKILGTLGLASSDVTAGSTAMADALSKSGVTQSQLADDLRKPDGLYVALKDLKDGMTRAGVSAEQQGEIIAKVFGGARTGKAVMALFQNLEGVRGKFDQITAAEGNFGEQVQKTHETAAFQWKAFAADLQVIAVKIGDLLTPVLVKTLELVRFLGRTIADAARPFVQLGEAGLHALAPLAGPIGGVIGALGNLVGAVASNRVAMLALGAAMIALKWESIVGGVSAAAAAVGGLLVDALGRAYVAGYRLVTMVTSLNAASLAGVAKFGAYAAAAAILIGVMDSISNASDHAKKAVSGITDNLDRSNVQSYSQALDSLHAKLNGLSGAAGFFTMIGHALSGQGDVVQDKKALERAIDDTTAAMQRAQTNTTTLAQQLHLTNDQVAALAHSFGIDLGSATGDQVAKFKEMASALGGDAKALNDAGNAAKGAAQDVLGFDNAITSVINLKLGLHGALLTMNQDLLDLRNNLAGGSRALDDNSAAGIKNSQALDKLIGDYSQYADQLGKSNVPQEQQIPLLQQQYDKLIHAGEAAGFTKDQIMHYIGALDLVRPVVATDIQTPGLPQAQGAVNNFQASLAQADGTTVAPQVTVQPGATSSTNAMMGLQGALAGTDAMSVNPPVSLPGLGDALRGLTTFSQMVRSLQNASINVHASFGGAFHLADGGVLDRFANGGIRSFASGGEDHSAQIVAAGAMRLFGEPETGGEAYIPLGMAKRARSLDILAEVMKRFGLTAADVLKMLGAQGQQLSTFATGGTTATKGSDGGSLAGTAATTLAGGYGKLAAGGDDLTRKAQDLTKRLVEQTKALKDQNTVVDDGHGKLGTFTDAITAHHTAVDGLIPRVVASTGVHLTDHKTVDGLTGGYHTLTGAIQQTPTAHHTNTDAPGAVTTTGQIRTLEATIRAMQPKTDRINIDTSVSGVFASLFANGGLVGYAGGGILRGPGTGTSDSILGVDGFGMPTARVSNGEFVVNERMTSAYLPLLQAINAGTFANGGLIRKLAAGGTVAARVSDPTLTDAGRLTPGVAALVGRVDAMLHPKAQTVIEHKAADEVKKKIAAMTAGFGGGVGRWAPLVLAVDKMLGLSPALLGVELSQMATESGGNPAAINLTDSNAAAGHPSQGLMQVIPGTFAAYAGPFRGRGILDPLANIYAGLNYARSRYGASLSALGHGHGYARGGLVGGMASGGILEDSPLFNPWTMGNRRVGPGFENFWNLTFGSMFNAKRDMSALGFGAVNTADVRRAQSALHVGVDGVIGPQTYAALQNAVAHHGAPAAASRSSFPSLPPAMAHMSAAAGHYLQTLHALELKDPGGQVISGKWVSSAGVRYLRAMHAADLLAKYRASVAGPEAVTRTPRPTSVNSSWLGLHVPVAPATAHVTTVVQLDSKVLWKSMQTHALKNERRNATNGLTKARA